MSEMTLISVKALHVQYGKEPALSNVSLQLERGTVMGVIGADGAGKTSLLRAVVGLVMPAAGHVQKAPGIHLGYVPQHFSLYGELSLEENLAFFGSLNGIKGSALNARMAELLDFTGLSEFRHRAAAALSGGMKQKLSVAVSLLHRPECVVLDEPTNGVDPVARGELWELIGKMREEGVSVLVSTQYLDEAERCDQVLLLHQGQNIQSGSPERLQRAFPYRMWAITDSEELRSEAEAFMTKPGIRHVYARGSHTMLVIDDATEARESLEQWQREKGCTLQVKERPPSMEDVFIALTGEEEEQDDSSQQR